MFANVTIRKIENGFVVGDGGPNQRLMPGMDGASGERYFATEEELRAAAGDILMQALVSAGERYRRAVEEQRRYAGAEIGDSAAQRRASNRP